MVAYGASQFAVEASPRHCATSWNRKVSASSWSSGLRMDCVVDGIYAQRSTVASQSTPAAAQRDGGEHGRSTIIRAVHRTRSASRPDSGAEAPMNLSDTSSIYTSLTGATTVNGRPHVQSVLVPSSGFTFFVGLRRRS